MEVSCGSLGPRGRILTVSGGVLPQSEQEPCDASAGGTAELLLREIALLPHYPPRFCLSALQARRTPPLGDRSEFPELPRGPGSQAPLSPLNDARAPGPRGGRTHSRPGPRAALPPAPSSHPTLSCPCHLTPPPSPAAPRTPPLGLQLFSPRTAHLPALGPGKKKHFPKRSPQPSLPHRGRPPLPLLFLGGRGAVASD